MPKPMTMTVAGVWWGLDARGRWLVYDDADSRWRVSDVPPRGDPDPGSELMKPPIAPPEDLRADGGVESLSDRVKELVSDINRQAEDECGSPVRFSALVTSTSRSLQFASKEVLSELNPFRKRTVPEDEAASPDWFVLALTDDAVLAYSCLYLPMDLEVWPRRSRDYVEIRERLATWPRGSGVESIRDIGLGHLISLNTNIGARLPNRLVAPKGWGGMGRELIRLLEPRK